MKTHNKTKNIDIFSIRVRLHYKAACVGGVRNFGSPPNNNYQSAVFAVIGSFLIQRMIILHMFNLFKEDQVMKNKKWKISFTHNGISHSYEKETSIELDLKHAAIILREDLFPEFILIDLPNSNKAASVAILEHNGIIITNIETM